MAHPGVGLGRRGEHLDEDMQVFAQMVILGLAALPQLFLLMERKKRVLRITTEVFNSQLSW